VDYLVFSYNRQFDNNPIHFETTIAQSHTASFDDSFLFRHGVYFNSLELSLKEKENH
jgi:hypothetical protein